MDAEAICVGREKSNAVLQRDADSQLQSLADGDEDHLDIGRRGAAALEGAIYRHVRVDSDQGLTVIETRTRSGQPRRLEIPPHEIDEAFASTDPLTTSARTSWAANQCARWRGKPAMAAQKLRCTGERIRRPRPFEPTARRSRTS